MLSFLSVDKPGISDLTSQDWFGPAVGAITIVLGLIFIRAIAKFITEHPKLALVLIGTIVVLAAIVFGKISIDK